MTDRLRYTILLDDDAIKNMIRLRQSWGLKNNAQTYELAVRVLSWLTEQQLAGYEVGRFKDEVFQPLLMPSEPRRVE